jgi:hypothetical protein
MTGDTYTIVKGYKVYRGDPTGEPIAEFSEPQLYSWLRGTGGYSAEESARIIVRVDINGSGFIVFP